MGFKVSTSSLVGPCSATDQTRWREKEGGRGGGGGGGGGGKEEKRRGLLSDSIVQSDHVRRCHTNRMQKERWLSIMKLTNNKEKEMLTWCRGSGTNSWCLQMTYLSPHTPHDTFSTQI